MKIISLGGGILEDYHGGSGNGSYNNQDMSEVFQDYIGEPEKLSELSLDTKNALLLAFAFNDTLSEYAKDKMFCLVRGNDLEYIDPQDPKKVFGIMSVRKKDKPKKILHIDYSSLFMVDTSKPVHVYKIDTGGVLFAKPGCPGVACNLFKGKIFVPKGTVVLLGYNDGDVYEYDPENMEKLLAQVKLELKYKREDPLERQSPSIPFDYTQLVTKSVNVKNDVKRLIYKKISNKEVCYDVRQENSLICLDVSNSSCVKIGSSNGKKISLFIESLSIGSTIICGSNVTDIFVNSVNHSVKIKCAKNCRMIYFRGEKKSTDLTIEHGDWDAEVGLKK